MSHGFATLIAGVNDNDILVQRAGDTNTFDNAHSFTNFQIGGSAGAVDVEVSLDGTNFLATVLALQDEQSVAPTTRVVVTAAGRLYTFSGMYRKIRVRQNGAAAAVGYVLSYKNTNI